MRLSNVIHEHRMVVALVLIAFALAVFSVFYLEPRVVGDSPSYVEAMGVMVGIPAPADFVPNRILTTFGGLALVLGLTPLFGILPAWLLMNVVFYLGMALASFFLLRTIFENEHVALLGALFIVGNYASLVFGASYLMDAGGWTFLLLALWGVSRFVVANSTVTILWASAAVGAGALFKEYALLGCIAVAVALVSLALREPARAVWLMAATAVLALAPVALVHLGVYQVFGYTYLDWVLYNTETYTYVSRFSEYTKALGSLLQLLVPLAVWGAWLWGREIIRVGWTILHSPRHITILAIVLSGLPVLFWGGITQRVLFVLVPAATVLACFVFERYQERWHLFIPVVVLYIIISFSTDTLLGAIDLPF